MSSVGQVLGGALGAVVGTFTPGVGPWLGAQIGMSLGGFLDPPKGPTVEGPRLSDLSVQTSTYGAPIPRVYGTCMLSGNVFWVENNKYKEVFVKKKSGGKGGPKTTTRTPVYYATFAVGLSEGEIAGVLRIRIGSNLIYNAGSTDPATIAASNAAASGFRVYNGSETQDADPRMQATLGVDNTPAYRGLAYIVFDDLPLEKYGNSLLGAQVRVEVMQLGAVYDYPYTQASMPTSRGWRRSAWNGVIHVATGYISLGYYATSPDGVTWTDRYIGAAVYLMDVAWGNDKFVMVGTGSNAYTSPDGVNWTPRAYAQNGWHTAVGWSGSHFLITTDSQPFERSADGVTWTSEAAPQGNNVYYLAVWNGEVWITVSGFGTNQIWTSPTGLAGSWTSRQFVSAATWNCGASLNGLTVLAAAGNGDTYTSPDGITWTLHPTAQPYGGVNQVVAGQDEFLFLQNHRYLITRDGVNFTNVTAMPVTGVTWTAGVWNGANFIAIAQNRTEVVLIQRLFLTASDGTLDDIISAECLRSGLLSAGDIDVAALTTPVHGYRIGNRGTLRSALEPLQIAYPFDVVQRGYRIAFIPRGGASVATISAADLGAHGDGEESPVRITISREMDSQLPRRIAIQYLDSQRDHERGEQYAERGNTPATNIVALEIPVVLDSTEAAGIAEVLLYLAWLERYELQFNLPAAAWNGLEPADVVALPTDEGTASVRLVSIDYTSDGRLECKARYNLPAIYTPTATGAPPASLPVHTIVPVGGVVYHLLDIPQVHDVQASPGFLVGMCGALDGWQGGALMQSADAGTTWADVQDFDPPGATIGTAGSTIGSVDHRMIDKASVLTVTLASGDLYDVTEAVMLGGANHFAYGADGRWEIIAAQKCTLQSGKTYVLRDLLRGRFGSEWAMGLHQVGDAIVLLDTDDLAMVSMSASTIGLSRLYRGITYGRDLSTDSNRSFTYQAVNLKPLAPILLNGHRDASGNWSLSWVRRARGLVEWRDYVDTPLSEATEQYQIEIFSSSGYTTVKRTLTLSAAAASYTTAEQTADFGSNQATLYLRIYQLSATVGRGYPLQQSITR